jgi:glycosyltransferase involved in cell wall biosynthesis
VKVERLADKLPANMTTRILFTESSRNLGGQELQALQQMVTLNASGSATQLACRKESGIALRAEALGLQVTHIPFRNSLHLPSLLAMRQLIKAWRPDAIVSHSGHDANITAIAARTMCHRPSLIRARTYQPGLPKAWTYNALADVTVVPSAALRNEILVNPRITPERIRVLYPGIDFDVLEQSASTPLPQTISDWLRRRTGPLIVQAAMLRPEKGHMMMLEVIAKVSTDVPGLRYVIAGDGAQKAQIAQRIDELGLSNTVLMAGLVNPIAPLLKDADLVVMPSLYEPLGMAQAEALALGAPVVASNVGGIPETIIDQKTGLLVEPGNIDAWVSTMTWALKNLPQMRAMAKIGGEQMRAQFSVTGNINGLLQAINNTH